MLKLDRPSRPSKIDDLLPPQLVARLGALDITSRKILSGKLKGERRSKRRGQSVEFADHRPYVVGDDLRHIDWNIFGRLDRMFLKLFLEEEDLSLHLVIDASASHDAGNPSKFLFMQQVAMALAYIGLSNMHRVTVSVIGGANIAAATAPTDAKPTEDPAAPIVSHLRDLRGRRSVHELARFLIGIEPGGAPSFTEACKRIAITRRGKGVMLLLSDFLVKEGYDTGLRLLVGKGYDVFAVQVLSPQELEPDIGGDLRLKDCEDGDLAEVTISAPLLKKYKQHLTAYCNRLRDFCARREIMHLLVPSSTPVDVTVLDYLRRRGLVK
jgi:uncharacterized protein (DUF58 family)